MLIAIYGKVAAGKSYLCHRLIANRQYTYYLSLDSYIAELYKTNNELKKRFFNHFGKSILVNNEIDKLLLIRFLINDEEDYGFYTIKNILNNFIREKLLYLKNQYRKLILVIEVPLLRTYQLQDYFDLIIFVDTPLDVRYSRFMKRSKYLDKYQLWRWITKHQNYENQIGSDFFIKDNLSTNKTLIDLIFKQTLFLQS